MKRRILVVAVTLAVAALAAVPSRAEVEPGCFADDGSVSTPHLIDPTNDWNGPVLGNGEASLGDVYREATDLTGAWISHDADGGYTAHWKTVTFSGNEAAAVFFFFFDWAGNDPAVKNTRFVSAQIQFYGSEGGIFRYGYLDNTTPGVATLTNEGYATGGFIAGSPGEINVKIPMEKFGATPADAPGPGAELPNIVVESRVVSGHPGHGHREVTPQSAGAGGLVWITDTTANATGCSSIGI